MKSLAELKEYIAQNYDVCLICDELELEPEDILDAFEDRLCDRCSKFEEGE